MPIRSFILSIFLALSACSHGARLLHQSSTTSSVYPYCVSWRYSTNHPATLRFPLQRPFRSLGDPMWDTAA